MDNGTKIREKQRDLAGQRFYVSKLNQHVTIHNTAEILKLKSILYQILNFYKIAISYK